MKLLTRKLLTAALMMVASAGAQAAELPFETTRLAVHKVERYRLFEGTVEAVNKSTVSAQTSGRILAINFDVDDFVKAGEIIVRFSDREQKAAVMQAENTLNLARAQRIAAEQDFKRVKKLFASGTVSRARYDTAKSSYDSAVANEARAAAALKQAREQLSYTIVRAPYSGFVVERHVEIGEVANPGQPLMTGFSLEKLRIRADVPEQYARAIRKANRARVVLGEGKTIKVTSLTVFPFADPKSNTVTVRLALPDGVKEVFPGLLVKAAFSTGTTEALTIPARAIARRGELTGAYVIDSDNRLHLQQIRIGRKYGKDGIEVLSGLAAGDRVALDPLKAAIYLKKSTGSENE